MLYSNTKLKQQFLDYLIAEVGKFESQPVLNIIQVGDNFASTKYVNLKKKIGESVGIKVNLHKLSEAVSYEEVEKLVLEIVGKKEGLIVQLPVPEKIHPVLQQISSKSDVDLLGTEFNLLWKQNILPPTIGAIDLVIKEITEGENFALTPQKIDEKINLRGKICVVVGQGILVGDPMVKYFMERKATVISMNSSSPDPKTLTTKADIVVCAAGRPKFMDNTWFKEGAIVVDASTSESDGQLAGDVDTEDVKDKVILCPSPKGIGPLTVRYIFSNLVRLKKSS